MRLTIDDLALLKVSALVARGDIGRSTRTALIRFGDDGVEYAVGVVVQPLPAGGFWAKFKCPRCGGNAQRLRLLEDQPACGACCRATGLIYRSQATATAERHAVTTPKRIANLSAAGGFRVHRPTRKVELRARVEAALRRSIIVTRQHGHDEFAERVKRLSRT